MGTQTPLWRSIFNKRMLICVFCGFSSGMPLYVLYQLLPAWLRDQGADLSTISLFSLIAFPYTWKFLWAPLMDRYTPPMLGRRRGWALVCQVALMLVLASLSQLNPTSDLPIIAAVAGLTALFSASQDIVLDAYRRELLPDVELGMGNSWFVNAYRISSLIPGSLALILADRIPWSQVHLVVAAWMLVGIATTLLMPEPEVVSPGPRSFTEAVVEPFREFFGRSGVKSAVLLLAFMLFYKLGDSMATALATPFYLDMGFSKTEIGTIAKGASLWSAVVGAMIGGVVMLKLGINRSLWLFGVVQLLSILGFAVLSADSNVQPIIDARPIADVAALPEAAAPFVVISGDEIRRLDLNTATPEAIAVLPPLGLLEDDAAEATAAAIVAARPLSNLSDLPALPFDVAQLSPLVTVQTNLNTASRTALTAH
ncbi:MAG: PAT family beta-lactamase induction signal transducer AmpG, partial [Myxococcota bacterium]